MWRRNVDSCGRVGTFGRSAPNDMQRGWVEKKQIPRCARDDIMKGRGGEDIERGRNMPTRPRQVLRPYRGKPPAGMPAHQEGRKSRTGGSTCVAPPVLSFCEGQLKPGESRLKPIRPGSAAP